MTHDLDDAIRASLRRNAESAPTVVDLDGVRDRATAIGRRRVLDASLAVAATVIVALGIGVLVHGMSGNQTLPPPAGSPTATSGPGALPWIAYTNFDANAQPSGATRVLIRINGTDRTVTTVPGNASQVTMLGWYGVDHQTLAYAVSEPGVREQTLYTVAVSTDGSYVTPPQPLTVRTVPKLTPGQPMVDSDGTLRFWMPDKVGSATSPAQLLIFGSSLDDAAAFPVGPGSPVFASADKVGLLSAEGQLRVSRLDGANARVVPVCGTVRAHAVSSDGGVLALACTDGSAELVDLTTLKATRIPDIPETTDPAILLGLWWDPTGRLHATTNPGDRTQLTTDSWSLSGGAWVRSPDAGLVTRFFTSDAPTMRLQRLDTDGAAADNAGRLIIETDPPVDLGPAGGSVAVRPVPAPAPTPQESVSQLALPAPPATLPWTAWVGAASSSSTAEPSTTIWTNAGGSARSVYSGSNVLVVGWSGPDHRTLLWLVNTGLANPDIYAQAFAADGSPVGAGGRLSVPGIGDLAGTPFLGDDGRLVLVRSSDVTSAQPFTVIRVAADLSSATTQQVQAGVPVFATAQYVGLMTTASKLLVVGPRSVGTWTLPTQCYYAAASVSPAGDTAAFSCRSSEVDLLDLATLARGAKGGVTRLHEPATGAVVLTTWYDASGNLHAFTVPQVSENDPHPSPVDVATAATWDRDGAGWSPSHLPLASYRWTTGPATSVRLSPVTAPDTLTTYTVSTDSEPSVTLTTLDGGEQPVPGAVAVRPQS